MGLNLNKCPGLKNSSVKYMQEVMKKIITVEKEIQETAKNEITLKVELNKLGLSDNKNDYIRLNKKILQNFEVQFQNIVNYVGLYVSTNLSQVFYPFSLMYRLPELLLPQGSAIRNEQRFVLEETNTPGSLYRPRSIGLNENDLEYEELILLRPSQSRIPHVRPETPRSVTHNHDEDSSDDDDFLDDDDFADDDDFLDDDFLDDDSDNKSPTRNEEMSE